MLRAETNLLNLDEIPEDILRIFSHQAQTIASSLGEYINKLPPTLSPMCSFEELRQNYMGTCDEKSMVYNFLNINFS